MATISGGDKLEQVLKAIGDNMRVQMNVGILEGATNEDTGEKIAPYAAANEYGTLHIPARPFMRNTVAEHSAQWAQTLGKLVEGQTKNAGGVEKAFNVMGTLMVQDIRDTIEHSVPPPNVAATVAAKRRKGRAKPDQTLVDSGSMQRAIDFEIIKTEAATSFSWWNPLTWFGR
ncbi:hypothetical protein [Pantoea sp.]|uniref:hypothetical protein n=1 Tax=Pantoea sp. TaxID=69393 RepID=UPI0028A986B5|nr:hypothetical protein [Pantoea sp.]